MHVGCYAFHFDLKLTRYSSALPPAVWYHLPQDFPLLLVLIFFFPSTPAKHGPTKTSAGDKRIGIEQNNGHYIRYATSWETTMMHPPLSPLWCCKCGHWKYEPGCKFKNGPSNRKLQWYEATHDQTWVYRYPVIRPLMNDVIYSWCM